MQIFRAYDIRGIYGKDLDEKVAFKIGKTLGTFFDSGKIVVGMDTRFSSESLKKFLIEGLVSCGCEVFDIGIMPTPSIYFCIKEKGYDAGIMVSASHNTYEWNGFIPVNKDALICSEGFGMEKIKEIFYSGKWKKGKGNFESIDLSLEYLNFLLKNLKVKDIHKVVLDTRSGATSFLAKEFFERINCEVKVINNNIDGKFLGEKPDVSEELLQKLRKEVIREKAEVGIAFDADGDRVGFIDEKGNYIGSGNISIPIFSSYYLEKFPKSKIVFDICCSSSVENFIKEKGGIPIVNRVGHSFILKRMMEEKAVFGGEYSNHLYFSEINYFDDALFAGAKILEIMENFGKKLSEISESVPKIPYTKVESIYCEDEKKFEVVKRIKKRFENQRFLDLDGIKVFFDEGWFLIRASNTNPSIKINAEAKTMEKAKKLHDIAKNIVEEEIRRFE